VGPHIQFLLDCRRVLRSSKAAIIPFPALWPLVMERVNQQRRVTNERKANVLYYLISSSPAISVLLWRGDAIDPNDDDDGDGDDVLFTKKQDKVKYSMMLCRCLRSLRRSNCPGDNACG
jgi:hypothetical protein